ncbi:MAG: YhcH/YjgK/YiaL family protein [Rikenellaceae bacterium]
MKKFTIAFAMLAACLCVSCAPTTTETKECTKSCDAKQAQCSTAWFDSMEWLEGAPMKPAVKSIDINTFTAHYAKFPERWKTVFNYLATQDLKNVALGVTELTPDVRVIVQEYETRPIVTADKVLYERHQKYIDVQCIITGEEMHGASKLGNGVECIPYKDSDDIMFYTVYDVPFYIIRSGYFTIFFPDDMHTTNYGFGDVTNVRKLVFKVKFE